MLRSRELRHRLELQRDAGTAKDERGQITSRWVTQGTLFCKVEQLNATETLTYQQLYSSATQKVTTRFNRDVTPKETWRLKFGERYLYVFSIDNPLNLNEETIFICGEELPN